MGRLKAEGKKALVPYVVSGDPVPEATLPILHALVDAGADIIELGVPFSDPMAEGPVIQKGHERALQHRMSLKRTLEIVREFRVSNQETPVVLMGYANPIEKMGYESFAAIAREAGVDGVLTVDLPPEEAEQLNVYLKAADIENIFLIAPTTSPEREKMISSLAGGYLYYVSLKGVTGAGHLDIDSVKSKLAEIRDVTPLPVCVGFGIKDPASASSICEIADGAVVGSVLVDCAAKLYNEGHDAPEELAAGVAEIIRAMRQAIDSRS